MSSAASRQEAASSAVTSSSRASSWQLFHQVGGGGEVVLRHQVRVEVVVLDRAVLVRAGDALDAELAVRVVLAERAPQPGGLDEQRQADLALELLVLRRVQVLDDGVGDVGVDVEGGRAGRPVAGALLAADRPPRERGAVQAELRRVRLGHVHDQVPPAQRVGGGLRPGVGQHRQHERLGVPEGVPVVPGPGQALGRDRPVLGARARPAGCGTGRSGRPAGSPRRRRPRRRRPPRTRRGTGAARRAARPSRSAWRPRSRPPPGRSARAVTAARTSRSRGT